MEATAQLWDRLGRPYDPVAVIEALLGLSASSGRHLVGALLATSAEAERLLDRMPFLVRSLAVSTTSRPERHHGEVRGPVLWSETLAARASSAGDTGLFVCASTAKAYDTDENRVLVAALDAIRGAAHASDSLAAHPSIDPTLRRARFNGTRASRFLEHRTLSGVVRGRPDGRSLRRARAGTRRTTYRPAVEVLERAGEPLLAAEVAALVDARTHAQHDLLLAVLDGIVAQVGPLPALRVEDGELRSGPVRYVHARRGDEPDRLRGIVVGDVLLDVPDRYPGSDPFRAQAALSARSGALQCFVVMGDGDHRRAVSLAVRHAARP